MRFVLPLCAAALLSPVSALGWGCAGHQMIGLIARAHLTPAASTAVDQILRENPLDPNQKRYCQDRPADPIADAASWADDMRTLDKTFLWHYIDIPLGASRPDTNDISKWCEPVGPSVDGKDAPGCITSAIGYEWAILRDKTKPGEDRAKALRYLIHFLGDLSQPLHNTDNHDQGGNCTRLNFFANERPENLHSIWDDRLLSRDMQARQASQQQYAAGLDREFAARWPAWGEAKTDIPAWAWEGHEIAAKVTYGALQPALPVADPAKGQADRAACDVERNQVAAQHIAIGDAYAEQAVPVIRQQLVKAAYRLAGLLNQTFPN